ncbi:hypothetical protein M8A51_01150 [Schlegelella sp. S2-27]|uniref:Uncharacterized protein n=1 Tax=Caldimonas mangrovi TaxID=2944811 RepID=A0ABT0YIT3_9BURK|nr:hypothetical protein [Caldimonas mangrovi]MCM5678137.1 hypothetical protein [Caldimonas mangrovi]
MKKTDLEKNKALKIAGQMKQAGVPSRFGAASTAVPDRRERRRREQAMGLVPFAVKLPGDLVAQLRKQAEAQGTKLDDLVADLLGRSLERDS